MIEDWELGQLYWNCLKNSNGDEAIACQKVKQKYFNDFAKKDLYFFLGTTKKFHNVGRNPFVIIGTFYPPKDSKQLTLF
jgi:Ni,Fe-hydrogenase I cytochrome b subunit